MDLSLRRIEKIRRPVFINTLDIWNPCEVNIPDRLIARFGLEDYISDDVLRRKINKYMKLHFENKFKPIYFTTKRISDSQWNEIPDQGGLYVLYQDTAEDYEKPVPVYIGMSETSIRNRIIDHLKRFVFGAFTWVTVFDIIEVIPHLCFRDLLELERKLIKKWSPKYNIVHN